MKPSSRIETERLVLRLPHLADAPSIARSYAVDPEVTMYLSWRPHERMDDTQAFVRDLLRRHRAGDSHPWVIAAREGGAVLGMVEARRADEGWELGYVLARPSWGQGLMTESVVAVLPELARAGIDRVFADTDADNVSSQRVLEKAGFTRHCVLEKAHVRPNLGPEPRDSIRFVVGD